MPARDFLRLLLTNIHTEDDVGVVRALLGQAALAVKQYVDSGSRDALRLELATAAREAMERAEPGSDLQLVWAQTFIGTARTDQDLAIVRGLLDGSRAVRGLEVDIDVRWQLVQTLVARGTAGNELIEAELARDPTDAGARRAATVRAARPTPAAKAEAWARIVDEPELPLATLGAVMSGFMRWDQEELVKPYAGKYFAALEPIWRSRHLEASIAFAARMYPAVLMSDELLKMTDDYLAQRNPAPPIRRYLLEQRDHVRRARRARECDAAAGVGRAAAR
jgi:aminopeptidase N